MSKFYTPVECRRKAVEHWDMARTEAAAGDAARERLHTEKGNRWANRAFSGGYTEGEDIA